MMTMPEVSRAQRPPATTTARPVAQRRPVPARAKRPPRDTWLSAFETLRLVADCADDAVAGLGCRPVIHAEWPDDSMLPVGSVECLVEAVDAALLEVHRHVGVSAVIMTIESRADAIELCVVDNGWHPDIRRSGEVVVDEPTGVERGIEEYEGHGTCQWWLIPLDVEPLP
jgi:hypothetical protein